MILFRKPVSTFRDHARTADFTDRRFPVAAAVSNRCSRAAAPAERGAVVVSPAWVRRLAAAVGPSDASRLEPAARTVMLASPSTVAVQVRPAAAAPAPRPARLR